MIIILDYLRSYHLYKPSMFNRCVDDSENNSLILFNSYFGLKSVVRIGYDKVDKVKKWLNSNQIILDDTAFDSDFSKLLQNGLFVENFVNEKERRNVLLAKLKNDSVLRLVIHTSKSCNFRCKYCYLHFNDNTTSEDNISSDTQEGIINFVRNNIHNFSAVHVDWFGGEPLLAVDAIKDVSDRLIEICRNAHKPYEAVITTNGYLLTPQNIDVLIKAKVRHFAITIDGTREFHDALRVLKNGKATFDKIISNLLYIKDHVKTRTISISIRSNITVNAIESLKDYYDYYNKMFGDDSRFYLFVRPVKDLGGDSVAQISSSLFSNKQVDFSVVLDTLSGMVERIKFDANFVDLHVGGIRCYANNLNRYTIGVDGLISKCDESIPDVGIGILSKNGEMKFDNSRLHEWMKTSYVCDRCDDCFYSCCCFMDPCPKSRVISGQESCPSTVKEIDSLILLYAKSYQIETI